MNSGGGIVGMDFDPTRAMPAYNWMTVAKSALESVNRFVAREAGQYGVRSNLVAAGPIRTLAMSAIVGGALGEAAGDQMKLLEEGWDQRAPAGLEHEGPHAGREDGVRVDVRLAARHHRHDRLRRRRRQHPAALTMTPGLRRPAAAVLRRTRGAGAGTAVPGERHPRPQHPAGAPRRRRRALPALRRRVADQRHQPRADRADCGSSSTAAARRCRSTSATATGRRTSRTRSRRCATTGSGAPRCSPRRHGAATPAARSTRRTSPGRARAVGRRRAGTGQAPAVLRPPAVGRDVRRRRSRAAAATLPADLRAGARLVFTAHSIPLRADDRAAGRDLYSRQVAYAARLVAAAAGYADYDQVWQSRSGPPQVPWLEPDVCDHLRRWPAAGTKAVIVCPIGFVADHIEVVWDLDNELREQADAAGIAFARATTPNARPALRAAGRRPDRRTAQRAASPRGCRRRIRCPATDSASTGRCARRLPRCVASALPGRLQDRADGGQPRRAHHAGQRPQRVVGDLHLRGRLQADRHQPGTHGDDRVDVGGVLQHPQRALRGVVGSAVQPAGLEHLLDEAARVGDVGTPSAGPQRAERVGGRPHGGAQLVLGLAEVEVLARPARRAASTPSTPARSARDRQSSSGRRIDRRRTRSRAPGRSRSAAPRDDDDGLAGGDGVGAGTGCPRRARGRRPGTGSATAIAGSPVGGPAAVRSVCSSDTAPASVRSGHGNPVRPAATES